MSEPTCQTCPCWEETARERTSIFGVCKRFPPTRNPANQGAIAFFPLTLSEEACWEHPELQAALRSRK